MTGDNTGLRLLLAVLGFWIVMRAVNKDKSGRTLVDRLTGGSGTSTGQITGSAIGSTLTGAIGNAGAALGNPLAGAGIAGRGAAAGILSATGAANPVPGASPSRIDEGVDYTLGPQGFRAPWASKVVSTTGSFFRGGQIVLQFLEGPYAGAHYFVAEGVKPAKGVGIGSVIPAGGQVAASIPSPYNGVSGNIESGWWDINSGQPLAKVTGGYSEGQTTAAGVAWNKLVQQLGGAAGSASTAVRGSVADVAAGAL